MNRIEASRGRNRIPFDTLVCSTIYSWPLRVNRLFLGIQGKTRYFLLGNVRSGAVAALLWSWKQSPSGMKPLSETMWPDGEKQGRDLFWATPKATPDFSLKCKSTHIPFVFRRWIGVGFCHSQTRVLTNTRSDLAFCDFFVFYLCSIIFHLPGCSN